MQRTRFRKKFLKNPTHDNRYFCTKQRSLCVPLLRKEKHYFANLNENDITDFGILLNHFFLEKINHGKVLY